MTDEVQNQTAAAAPDQVAAAVDAAPTQAIPEVATGSETPVAAVGETPPQPDAAAAPVDAAQAKPAEDVEGADLTLEPHPSDAHLSHAHLMVSTWLMRVEAGLHVPLDELRALKARLEKWL